MHFILDIFLVNSLCRRLTEAIMFCHFGIQLQIPGNRLCPPVSLLAMCLSSISKKVNKFRFRVGT